MSVLSLPLRIAMSSRGLARVVLVFLMNLHHRLYHWITSYAHLLEPNGLHPKHRIMKYHDWFSSHLKTNDRVLDVGCGNGALTADLTRVGAQVTGIEIDESKAIEARRRAPRATIVVGDATKLSSNGQVYDYAVLSNVLEHVEPRVELLRELSKTAKTLLIRVPMVDRDWLSFYKREIGLEYRLDHTHTIEYTQADFRQEVEAAGLEVQSSYVRFGELYAVVRSPSVGAKNA